MNNLTKDQAILSQIEKDNGWVSNPLKLMAYRSGTVESFTNYCDQVFKNGTLTKREKALISIAVTVALKSDHCIHTKIEEGKKHGLSDDEIVQTILIAGIINGNTMLHTAYEAMNQ